MNHQLVAASKRGCDDALAVSVGECLTSASRASLMPVASSCCRLALSKASTRGVSSSGVFSWITSCTCTSTFFACRWGNIVLCRALCNSLLDPSASEAKAMGQLE